VSRSTRDSRCIWTALLLTSFGCLGAGCSSSSAEMIGVDVSFDSGLPRAARDQTARVEVYVVESCDAVSMGERPNDAIASTHALRDAGDGPLIGTLDPGPYGLYAVAQDATCAVVAAACSAVTIDPTAQTPLAVILSAFSGVGCAASQQCVIGTGQCLGPDGGIGGVNCYVEPDGTACSVDDVEGVCLAGACCTGCWDGGRCRAGDIANRCGAGGQLCKSCDVNLDICVAGQCTPISASEASVP